MQSVSSRIWSRVAVSISYDDNHYITSIDTNLIDEQQYFSDWIISFSPFIYEACPSNIRWNAPLTRFWIHPPCFTSIILHLMFSTPHACMTCIPPQILISNGKMTESLSVRCLIVEEFELFDTTGWLSCYCGGVKRQQYYTCWVLIMGFFLLEKRIIIIDECKLASQSPSQQLRALRGAWYLRFCATFHYLLFAFLFFVLLAFFLSYFLVEIFYSWHPFPFLLFWNLFLNHNRERHFIFALIVSF